MSGFRGVMAGDLLASCVNLNDDLACSLALISTGWRATHIAEWLDDAIKLARSMATAQDRETIIRDMAHEGDALPDASGVLSLLDLPGAAHSVAPGLFGCGS